MPTWGELDLHLRFRFTVTTPDPSWCGLVVEVDDHRVRAAAKPTADEQHVILVAQVCALDRLSPEAALRYNGVSEHGMLMLEGTTYVLRQVHPLARHSAEELDAMILAMAGEAARLRRSLAVPRPKVDAEVALFGLSYS